jgi:hypothetical protein
MALHNKKAISMCAAPNKDDIKSGDSLQMWILLGGLEHHLESLWVGRLILVPRTGTLEAGRSVMGRLTQIGIEHDDYVPPRQESEDHADDGGIDRSLAATMREIGQTLAGWLFFVVAVQLLLYGTRLI